MTDACRECQPKQNPVQGEENKLAQIIIIKDKFPFSFEELPRLSAVDFVEKPKLASINK